MFQHILNILSVEMLAAGTVLFAVFVLVAIKRPEICFVFVYPAYLFLGLFKELFPLSISAGSALFPLAAIIGSTFRYRRLLSFGTCEKLLVGILFLIVVSVSYSTNKDYGWDKASLFCFMVAPIVILTPQVIRSFQSLRIVTLTIFLALVCYVIISAILLLLRGPIEERVSALDDVIVAGQLLGLMVIFGYIHIYYAEIGAFKKLFYSIIALISIFLIFITGTRQAILGIIITLLFMYWFVHFDWFKRLFGNPVKLSWIAFLGLVGILIGSTILSKILPEETKERFSSIEGFFSNFTPEEIRFWQEESESGRTKTFGVAIQSFLSHPLSGLGTGGYQTALSNFAQSQTTKSVEEIERGYPHNILLECAVEQGVLGLLLILGIFYLNFKMIFELRDFVYTQPLQRYLVCSCVGMYIYGWCVSMSSLDVPRMIILWWGMGLLIAAYRICMESRTASDVSPDY